MYELTTALTVFVLINLVDILSTVRGLKAGLREANPLAKKFIDRWGVIGIFLFKSMSRTIIFVMLIVIGYSIDVEWIVWIYNGVLAIGVAWNSFLVAKKLKEETK